MSDPRDDLAACVKPTPAELDRLLQSVYGVDWYDGDREWWDEMMDALSEFDTLEEAREWLNE